MMAGMFTLTLNGFLLVLRTRRSLMLENLALRHQLAVLRRSSPRPRLRTSDRLFWVLLCRMWTGWADALSVVRPETVIRWHRTGLCSPGGARSCSLLLPSGSEIRTDQVGPRWVSFAAKAQCVRRTAAAGPPSTGMG